MVNTYYAVAEYITSETPPEKIIHVTTNLQEALETYLNYWENIHIGVGCYVNEKLIDILKIKSNPTDGPGLYKKSKLEEMFK